MTNRCLTPILILFVLLVPTWSAAQQTHVVNQVGLTFVPADLTIQVGDTVRWVHGSGIHTVTSGEGATDPDVASLFDAPLSAAAPSFEFVFTTAGDVPYFCRPHEGLDMKAIVRVEDPATSTPPVLAGGLVFQRPYPNPFNPRVVLGFSLVEAGPVNLFVHDARGRLVRRLLDGVPLASEAHETIWNGLGDDGRPAPSGVYYFRLRSAAGEVSTRAVLAR